MNTREHNKLTDFSFILYPLCTAYGRNERPFLNKITPKVEIRPCTDMTLQAGTFMTWQKLNKLFFVIQRLCSEQIGVQFQEKERYFSLFADRHWSPPSIMCNPTRGSFQGLKQLEREGISTSPYVLVAWCVLKQRKNLNLFILTSYQREQGISLSKIHIY